MNVCKRMTMSLEYGGENEKFFLYRQVWVL